MPKPLVRFEPPRLLVGDTGVLMNEVVQGLRRKQLTSLLAALSHDACRLYIAAHVAVEIERDLPRYAEGRQVDPDEAVTRWRGLYLPHLTIVDVPDTWGDGDERVGQVAARHHVDAPTARLATALAPCHALVQDPDLTEYGFGNKDWLPLAHASANQAEMEMYGGAARVPVIITNELAKAAGRVFARLPDWAQLAILLTGLVGLYWWRQSGRAVQHIDRARDVSRKVVAIIVPPAAQMFQRYQEAQVTWQTNVVEVSTGRTLSMRVARALASADGPLTAAELAKVVEAPGNLRDRAAQSETS